MFTKNFCVLVGNGGNSLFAPPDIAAGVSHVSMLGYKRNKTKSRGLNPIIRSAHGGLYGCRVYSGRFGTWIGILEIEEPWRSLCSSSPQCLMGLDLMKSIASRGDAGSGLTREQPSGTGVPKVSAPNGAETGSSSQTGLRDRPTLL